MKFAVILALLGTIPLSAFEKTPARKSLLYQAVYKSVARF